VGERKKRVGAAVMAVDAGITEAPVAFVADIAGPVTDVGEGVTEVAEFAFLKSCRRIVRRTIHRWIRRNAHKRML
jgi:hypothetical protein